MKRTQKLVTWGIVILVVLVVLLMLVSNLRRSSRVVLPDTNTSAEGGGDLPAEGGALTVVEVTPETVQAAIETLHRPEAYSRTVTVEYLWTGGSGTIELSTAVSAPWTRVDRTLPDGQIRHSITDGETTYIWYNGESEVYTGPAGAISADAEETIPTYEDVLASIKTAMNPDSPSAFSGYTSTFSKVEAPDAYTITITTETPNPLMLFHVAQIYVLKQENVEGKTEEEISDVVVGTGRYKFVEQVKEDHLDLTANEDYWGEVPEIKNVRFRPITNEATRTATMLTGEVDFTIDISVRDIDRLEGTDGISVLKQQGLREIYLNLDSREDSPLFPGQKNPMSDVKVRQAMYLAIDEGTIIKNIMNGCAFEMNSIIPEGYVG